MDLLMVFILLLLGACVSGVFLLIIFVFYFVARNFIAEGNESKRALDKCRYKRFSALDDYKTSCGNDFHDATETGDPVSDWAKFCPYCGREIECNDVEKVLPAPPKGPGPRIVKFF